MEILEAVRVNLLSPAVLFFALGVLAAVLKSDLKFPEQLYLGLTIYLLIAIGLKGGAAIAEAGLARVWLPALAAMILGALVPFWTYPVLRSANCRRWTPPPSPRTTARSAPSPSSPPPITSRSSRCRSNPMPRPFSP